MPAGTMTAVRARPAPSSSLIQDARYVRIVWTPGIRFARRPSRRITCREVQPPAIRRLTGVLRRAAAGGCTYTRAAPLSPVDLQAQEVGSAGDAGVVVADAPLAEVCQLLVRT